MHEILEDIVRRKRTEVAEAKARMPLRSLAVTVQSEPVPVPFFDRLAGALPVALIAEIKVASPTHPALGSLGDAVGRARIYTQARANAISFITENHYFKSDPKYLRNLKMVTDLPILQKDFVIDSYQVYESRAAGADAVLLIARLVDGRTLRELVNCAVGLGLEPVVEINDEADLAKAVATDARIIAVNARDLRTFKVDVVGACRLLAVVPGRYLRLGFSGITSVKEVHEYRTAGARGVLVGTALMQAPDIAGFIRKLRVA